MSENQKSEKEYLVEAKIYYPIKACNESQAKKSVHEILGMLGINSDRIETKIIRNVRSVEQRNSSERWFTLGEEHCKERGLTMDILYKKPAEVPITRHMLKNFFRMIGLVKYGKESTADLDTKEFSSIVEVCERTWAERLDFQEEFPNRKMLMYGEKKKKEVV